MTGFISVNIRSRLVLIIKRSAVSLMSIQIPFASSGFDIYATCCGDAYHAARPCAQPVERRNDVRWLRLPHKSEVATNSFVAAPCEVFDRN